MQPLHQQKETMVYVAIKELNPAVYNPRKWSKKATDDLTASIKRFGLIDFAGSGSTLIACEQTKRICYTMELDPKYCDVVIARWEKLTGQTAIKL